jgi:phosphocarrier protein HPr
LRLLVKKNIMTKKTLTIQNKLGLHMKPAGLLVKEAGKYSSNILVYKDDQEDMKVNAKSLIGVLMLAAGKGSTVTFEAEGADAEKALEDLEDLVVRRKFDEV